MLRKLANNICGRLSYDFTLILHTVDKNISKQFDIIFNSIKKSITVAYMTKNLKSCFPYKWVILVATEKCNVLFENWIDDRQGDFNREVVKHIQGQRMWRFFFVWNA